MAEEEPIAEVVLSHDLTGLDFITWRISTTSGTGKRDGGHPCFCGVG
jgi:hypothetical protein